MRFPAHATPTFSQKFGKKEGIPFFKTAEEQAQQRTENFIMPQDGFLFWRLRIANQSANNANSFVACNLYLYINGWGYGFCQLPTVNAASYEEVNGYVFVKKGDYFYLTGNVQYNDQSFAEVWLRPFRS